MGRKLWVFDLDGTLVDSFGLYFESLREIFPKYGARFTDDLRHAALTEHLVTFFARHLGSEAVNEALNELRARSYEDASRVPAFPGVLESLQELRQRGKQVAIWTNRDADSAHLIVKHSGLEPLVDMVVTGTCVERRKPDPQGLVRIIDGLLGSARPHASEVTMVGDHEHDVSAARSIGVCGVRASWHAYWKVDPCSTADHQFHDLPSFLAWMIARH